MSLQIIGLDFDNTIISYDQLFFDLAKEHGWISDSVRPFKKDVRDFIREKHSDIEWQILQAEAYGPQISRAQIFDGLKDFLVFCKQQGIDVYVISHKMQYAAQDQNRCDLRETALAFLRSQDLFEDDRYGLSEDQTFFEPTRLRKLERIRDLKCDIFVDDLIETFAEANFPAGIQKILFNPNKEEHDLEDVQTVSKWDEVAQWLTTKV